MRPRMENVKKKWPWVSKATAQAAMSETIGKMHQMRVDHIAEIDAKVERATRDREKTLEALINELARVQIQTPPGSYERCYITFTLPRDTFMHMADMGQMGDHLDMIARTIMHKVREQLVTFVRGRI